MVRFSGDVNVNVGCQVWQGIGEVGSTQGFGEVGGGCGISGGLVGSMVCVDNIGQFG